jgi:beta-glucanase (GH16 family)
LTDGYFDSNDNFDNPGEFQIGVDVEGQGCWGVEQHFPVKSAKLTTKNSFSFKYGKVQTYAKLPKGKWIWPAIWFLSKDGSYGTWPRSGEIDLLESRGNYEDGCSAGVEEFGSTIHYGQNWDNTNYEV